MKHSGWANTKERQANTLGIVRDNSFAEMDHVPAWQGKFGDVRRGAFFFLDRWLPRHTMVDRHILMARFFRAHKRLPRDPSDPRATFNDLIFRRLATDSWRVLERFCVDKEFAKLFVSALCPQVRQAANVEVIKFARRRNHDAAFARLRELSGTAVVAKPTHASGTVLFLKTRPGDEHILSFCRNAAQSYYHLSRESQYKGLEPKIIVEQDLSSDSKPPRDFKFFCANGKVLFCQIDVDRFSDHRRLLVDEEFNPIDVSYVYDRPTSAPSKPANFGAMLEAARALSERFYFVRIDLYAIRGETYFGELTFAPEGGAGILSDEEFGRAVLARVRSSREYGAEA